MSFQLSSLNFCLRNFVRPKLARLPDPVTARRQLERNSRLVRPLVPRMRIVNDEIQGPGGPVPIEWISNKSSDRRSIIIYLHGGAYIMGSPRTQRSLTTMIARESGWRVMVPDFRLAPEYPCPAGLEDALACYSYLIAQNYDAGRIALAGESAGGGMALALLGLIEEKGYPPPTCVMVGSPSTDLCFRGESIVTNAERDVMLPVERSKEVAGYYIGNSVAADDPRASPMYMKLNSPPPVFISVGKSEVLLDDARGMARALKEQGGEVELLEGESWPHAFPFFARYVPEALTLMRKSIVFLRKHAKPQV